MGPTSASMPCMGPAPNIGLRPASIAAHVPLANLIRREG
jgi:hypothetical protein